VAGEERCGQQKGPGRWLGHSVGGGLRVRRMTEQGGKDGVFFAGRE
jgi:hypothetical protein